MPVKYPRSPARWVVLQALADADEPLDRRQLTELTGVAHCNVNYTMQRPAKAGWVTVTRTGRSTSYKYLYQITDTGRQQLADYLKGLDA